MDGRLLIMICLLTAIGAGVTVNKLLMPKMNPELKRAFRVAAVAAIVAGHIIFSYVVFF